MASSTITLNQTLEWCKKFIWGRNPVIGNYLEPALSSANIVMQTILGAPFRWRWNRVITGFVCKPGQQDYYIFNWLPNTPVNVGWVLVDGNGNSQIVAISGITGSTIPTWNTIQGTTTLDNTVTWINNGSIGTSVSQNYSFAWIEGASLQTTDSQKWKPLSAKLYLDLDSDQGRPHDISAQIDAGDGNITFRVIPSPNAAYPIAITLQQKPPVFNLTTGVTPTWSPIPDEYSHIYNWGVLALMFLFADDPRFAAANQKFIANLLSTSQGLTDTEINIVLNNWQQITGSPITNADKLQQGFQGRGAL